MEKSLFGLVKPKLSLYELTRDQFFKTFPPETRNISVNGEIVAKLGEEVICDSCNGDVFFPDETGKYDHGFALSYDGEHIDEILCKDCAEVIIKKENMVKTK